MPEKSADSQKPQPQPQKPAEPQLRKLDAHSLRGLAHPLRIRLLGNLRLRGPATASQLAEQLGESSGATSYHLRQLAAYGFVEDAPEHGKGRERWWRPSQDGTIFDEALVYDADPATRGAAEVFLAEIVKIHGQELSTWLGDAHTWSVEWHRSSELSDFSLQLTPAQSHELVLKVHELINSYRDLPPSEDTETVRIHTHAFPVRTK